MPRSPDERVGADVGQGGRSKPTFRARYRAGMADDSHWTIHAERLVDDTRRARVSIAEVELPDGVRFEQWVLRLPKAAIVVVLNDAGDSVLMLWRHRFVINRWVWELPGGY